MPKQNSDYMKRRAASGQLNSQQKRTTSPKSRQAPYAHKSPKLDTPSGVSGPQKPVRSSTSSTPNRIVGGRRRRTPSTKPQVTIGPNPNRARGMPRVNAPYATVWKVTGREWLRKK